MSRCGFVHVSAVPAEARRGHLTSLMGCQVVVSLGTEFGSSAGVVQDLRNHPPSRGIS